MQIQEIEAFVRPDGTVRLEVRGVSGPQCLALTAELEKLLGGQVVSREHTGEFQQTQEQGVSDQLHLGR